MPAYNYTAAKASGLTDAQINDYLTAQKAKGVDVWIPKEQYAVPSPAISQPGQSQPPQPPKSQVQLQQQPKQQGYFSRVATDIGQGLGKSAGALWDTLKGKKDPLSAGLQVTTPLVEAAVSPITEGVSSIANALGWATGHPVRKALEAFSQTQGGQEATATLGKVLDAWNEFSTKHPDMAENAKDVVSLALNTPMLAGESQLVKGAVKAVGSRLAMETGEKIGASETGKLAEYVMPKMTTAETEKAVASHGVKIEGFGKEVKIPPSSRDVENSELVKEFIRPKEDLASVNGNLTRLNNGISEISDSLKSQLKANNRGFNSSQIKSMLESLKNTKKLPFVGEGASGSAYDKVHELAMEIIKKHSMNASGLWEARIEFDQIAQEMFPKVFDTTGTQVQKAIINTRTAINDYIADLSGNDTFKMTMRKLNAMYEVRDGAIAPKLTKLVGTSRFSRFAKAHPTVTKAAKVVGVATVGAAGIKEAYNVGKSILP